jgi:hypothetical protein
MPKKKTGQRKKAEKQKLRQKEIRNAEKNIAEYPCELFFAFTLTQKLMI